MTYKELLQQLDEYGEGHTIPHEAAMRIRQLEEILAEIKSFNGLRNDRDAYLYDLIEWGQGISTWGKPAERPVGLNLGRTNGRAKDKISLYPPHQS